MTLIKPCDNIYTYVCMYVCMHADSIILPCLAIRCVDDAGVAVSLTVGTSYAW